jgi:hypothetical protein
MLLKRDARGQLALLSAASSIQPSGDDVDEESRLVSNAKKIALLSLARARKKFGDGLDKQQEVLMHIADIIIETYAMESSLLRARKLASRRKETIAGDMTAVYLRDAMGRIEISARNVLASSEGLDSMPLLRKLAAYLPVNAVEIRRRIAHRLLATERYVI